jgi:hypothetical protein
MSAERGWIVPPRPNPHSVEAWAESHRQQGHHPRPAPTKENPEMWICDCPGTNLVAVWRILTLEQIKRKYAHLSRRGDRAADPEAQRHVAARRPATGPFLRIAPRYPPGED